MKKNESPTGPGNGPNNNTPTPALLVSGLGPKQRGPEVVAERLRGRRALYWQHPQHMIGPY